MKIIRWFASVGLTFVLVFSLVPMNSSVLAEEGTQVSVSASYDVVVRVGDTFTIDSTQGYWHDWIPGSTIVTGNSVISGSSASFTANSVGEVTIQHRYHDSFLLGNTYDEWFTVLVKSNVQYTITYTDGVADEEIFADESYTEYEGEATPSFSSGAPTRDGYVFAGWTNWSDTVVSDVIYEAIWKEDKNGNGVADEEKELAVATLTVCYVVMEDDGSTTVISSDIYEAEGLAGLIEHFDEEMKVPVGYESVYEISSIRVPVEYGKSTRVDIYVTKVEAPAADDEKGDTTTSDETENKNESETKTEDKKADSDTKNKGTNTSASMSFAGAFATMSIALGGMAALINRKRK